MYLDLRKIYWLNIMKKGITKLVARCSNCQKVKADHQGPEGITKDIDIPTLK